MSRAATAGDELRRQTAALFGGGTVAGLGDGEPLERFVRRGAFDNLEADPAVATTRIGSTSSA
ncbi:hypothetical protein [Tautonia sociabilis]|uniref:Uncharacterized protein n=1 Tax=Tautonia sociabilis TaxID=2080755 RepID=A0A432MEE5_9BACT|nr:hypothetical protein [Tautonia sociabilis]RUL83779.1 hypothetical protein TsocGM_21575 [Tautonia sociabilis]